MRRRSFFLFLGCLVAGPLWAQERKPLTLGIMPFNSTVALLKTHEPLRRHLEMALGRSVSIYTSPDYTSFLNDSLDGRFDLIITGPHFGIMGMERGFIPLVHYRTVLQPIFVVHNDSDIHRLADLRGKRIGLSSRLSISSIGGVKWLQDQGLKMGQDYQLHERATHGAAVAAVAVGELDAALTTYTPLKQIPPDIRAKVRVLPLNVGVPHLMTLANPRLGKMEIARVRKALETFPATSAGQEFFLSTGYEGYEPVTSDDQKALQPFVDLTRQLLRPPE